MYIKAEAIEENNANQLALDLAPRLAIKRSRRPALRICVSRKSSAISNTKHKCVREFTPIIPISTPIYDAQGKIVYRAGQQVNALDVVQFEHQMIFVDGLDKEQIEWAVNEALNTPSKLVFLGGALLKKLGRRKVQYHLDKDGELPIAFNVRCLPSIVRQEGSKFRIEEIPMDV